MDATVAAAIRQWRLAPDPDSAMRLAISLDRPRRHAQDRGAAAVTCPACDRRPATATVTVAGWVVRVCRACAAHVARVSR